MFFLFISLVFSVFIPYESTDIPALDYYNNETLNEVFDSSNEFVLLVVDESDDETSDKSYDAKDVFAIVASEFSSDLDFGFTELKYVPEYAEDFDLDAPFIVCMRDGGIVAAFSADINENACIEQINSLYFEPKSVATDIEELNMQIKNTYYTIIARENTYYDAYTAMINSFPSIGLCSIILATDDVFEQMGMSDAFMALFRKDDTVIAPCENSTESLLNATVPYYTYISDNDLSDNEREIAAIIIPDDFAIDDEFRDNLLNVAEMFPDFKFGITNEKLLSIITSVVDHEIVSSPDFAVFNYDLGYFYPTSNFSGISINETWSNMVVDLLTGIENKAVPMLYMSEEVPEEQEDPLFTKIVGKTFKDFIYNKEKDSIIMFVEGDKNDENLEVFRQLAYDLNESEINSIQFGYTDIFTNSDSEFPEFIRLPHVEFYRKGNKHSTPMFDHTNYNGLRRFIKSAGKVNIEVQPISEDEGWEEIDEINEKMDSYTPRTQKIAKKHIKTIKSSLQRRSNKYKYADSSSTEL